MTPQTPAPTTQTSNGRQSAMLSNQRGSSTSPRGQVPPPDPLTESPEFIPLPPALNVPELDLNALTPEAERDITLEFHSKVRWEKELGESHKYVWREDMTAAERDEREAWLSSGLGRKGLRIVIVTENFLPKVDGVTRTLARLLEHLHQSGHQCMLLGPSSTLSTYASHPLVGTLGIPLVVYPGLKLNFLRPKFLRVIKDFQPDVVHFVDPIWLGPQTMAAMELGWAGEEWVGRDGPALGGGMGGAVVASYHTNLATYATLFGLSWLTPVMWQFQRFLYSKTILTLCPSPSTKSMLETQRFDNVRLWPRGVDLDHFGSHQRSASLRARWGVGQAPSSAATFKRSGVKPEGFESVGTTWQGRKASLPMSPPLTPYTGPMSGTGITQLQQEPIQATAPRLPERVVLMYTGRISWEKNLSLLLSAYSSLPPLLPPGSMLPKLVFTGDGPARSALEERCAKEGWDAVFMGHRSGKQLAECYASADVFAFPSFTETFGQVVLEALASGLPVIGLDAEGTRDLVAPEQTGLLLPLPPKSVGDTSNLGWATICQPDSLHFTALARGYAELLARVVLDHQLREEMGRKAKNEGVRGYTWWDAMERCVEGYRESIRIARSRRAIEVIHHSPTTESFAGNITPTPSPSPSRMSRVNRVLSRRLAHRDTWNQSVAAATRPRQESRGKWRVDTAETIWHLKTILKALVVLVLFYAVYSHHQSTIRP